MMQYMMAKPRQTLLAHMEEMNKQMIEEMNKKTVPIEIPKETTDCVQTDEVSLIKETATESSDMISVFANNYRTMLFSQPLEMLREKCKNNKIKIKSTEEKDEIISMVLDALASSHPEKMISFTKEQLQEIAKHYCVKFTGLKKQELIVALMNYNMNQNTFINVGCLDFIVKTKETKTSVEEKKPKPSKKTQPKKTEEQETKIVAEPMPIIAEPISVVAEPIVAIVEEKEKETTKYKKQTIPKNIKVLVWNRYLGESMSSHKCLCCKQVTIQNTNFHVGHVIAEACGGTHEIGNLRPICAACNHSMGTRNMIEFVKEYGLYIG